MASSIRLYSTLLIAVLGCFCGATTSTLLEDDSQRSTTAPTPTFTTFANALSTSSSGDTGGGSGDGTEVIGSVVPSTDGEERSTAPSFVSSDPPITLEITTDYNGGRATVNDDPSKTPELPKTTENVLVLIPSASTALPPLKESSRTTSPETSNKRKKPGRNRSRTGVTHKKIPPDKEGKHLEIVSSSTVAAGKEVIIAPPSTENPEKIVIPTSGQLNDNPWFHGSGEEGSFSFGRGGSVREEEKRKASSNSQEPKVEPFVRGLGNPDWVEAKKEWGFAWHLHIFTTGPLFAALVFFGCLNLLRVRASTKLLGLGYYVTLNLLVVCVGLLRAVFLLFDGYNSGGRFPPPILCGLFDLVHPCLSAALAVLFLALIQETKVDRFPRCARRPGVIASVIIMHFALTLTADVVAGLTIEERSFFLAGTLLLISRVVFVVWTTLSVVSFFAIFKRARKAALRKQGEMIRVTFTKLHIDGARLPKKLPKPTLALSVNVALVAAVFGAALALLRVLGVFFVAGVPSSKEDTVEPWTWWGYHFASRVLELILCSAVIFVASQPVRNFETPEVSERDSDSWVPRRLSRSFNFRSYCCCCCRRRKEDPAIDLDDSYDAYFNHHLVHYNNRGFRNSGFSHSLEAHHRRWDGPRTNSLPPPFDGARTGGQSSTSRNPENPTNNGNHVSGGRDHSTMPIQRLATSTVATTNPVSDKTLSSNGTTTRHIVSSTGRSNRSVLENMASMVPPAVPPHGINAGSDGGRTNSGSRPTSMLFKDNGFIRFRREDDPEQPMELSDETTEEDGGSSVKDGDSVLAQAGSGTHSLCEADFVQSTLSPFFQHFGGHNHHHHYSGPPRVKLFSRCSLDTLDNSNGDASSEQLSNVTSKNGHSIGALDCHSKRHGSTCSSESAANSFDVTFYLQGLSRQSTPAIRSVSPLASAGGCRRFHGVPTNLDLGKDLTHRAGISTDGGAVNVACGTEDITPDSAVFMDLHLSEVDDPTILNPVVDDDNLARPRPDPKSRGFDGLSTDGDSPLPPWSHSLNDLSGFEVIRGWKASKTWLTRLKGSSFSLNGYELLPPSDPVASEKTGAWLRRVNSDRWKRPLYSTTTQHRTFASLSDVAKERGRVFDNGMIPGDSGLLGDCQEIRVDRGAQTEDVDFSASMGPFSKLRGNDEKVTAFNLIEERD